MIPRGNDQTFSTLIRRNVGLPGITMDSQGLAPPWELEKKIASASLVGDGFCTHITTSVVVEDGEKCLQRRGN